MAGKTLTDEQLSEAVKAYCTANDMQQSRGEEKPHKITIFKDTPQPGDVTVWLEDGIFRSSPVEFGFKFLDYISEGPTTIGVRPSKNVPVPVRNVGNAPGSALAAVQRAQSTEAATYSPSRGRTVATSKTNVAALMEAGGSLEIVSREHTLNYIEVAVRAILGDRHVDSSISIFKQEYLAKKAWDWILKVLMDEPGIVSGTDDYGMPEFKEGATIKVRLKDEGKSVLVPLPAKIALWREMAREWQFAGRVCETKAYSRACDMLLRGDFQSHEELAEEQAEIDTINESKPGGDQ